MGSSNGITRGQLRPHFSGRSPPFLVAALCVGLGILGVSYWSLCSQYNDLEEELKKALQQTETLKNNEMLIKNQLKVREDEFSEAQKKITKKEQQLMEIQQQLNSKSNDLNSLNPKLSSLEKSNSKCNEDLIKKENELGDAMTKLKDTEKQKDILNKLKDEQNEESIRIKSENENMKKELEELKKQLSNNNSASSLSPVANVGQMPNIDNNVLPSVKIENKSEEVNKQNEVKKEQPKSQAEPPINAENTGENALSVKQSEPVIAEPNLMPAQQQSPSINGLGEEDKKQDSLVAVEAMSPNEINDDKGYHNKEEEESKDT